MFKQAAGPDYIIFNGPDEQFMSGRVIGAEGAIGGTYGAMPELYLKLDEYVKSRRNGKKQRDSVCLRCNHLQNVLRSWKYVCSH